MARNPMGETRRVVFLMAEEDYQACVEEAEFSSLGSLSAWIRYVLMLSVRRYRSQREGKEVERENAARAAGKGAWPSGWPRSLPCGICGATKHDPATAHNLGWNGRYRAPGCLVWHFEEASGDLEAGERARALRAICKRFSVAPAEVQRQQELWRRWGQAAYEVGYDEALLEGSAGDANPADPTPPSDLSRFFVEEGACPRCGLVECSCAGEPGGQASLQPPAAPSPLCEICGRSYAEHSDADVAHCAAVLVEAGLGGGLL